jgi:peptidoglycan/xylan/chitin deacetylase (PgdA/CDA1 family)
MKKNKTILLTFDVEEFDTALRHKIDLTMQQQMEVGQEGLLRVIGMLNAVNHPPSTFYTTANFADFYPETIRDISKRHEIASHTYYHTTFKEADILQSKLRLEEIIEKPIFGFRMPNMADFDKNLIQKSGYSYDSSINPTYLPGKYNYLHHPTTPFKYHNTTEIPASVVPFVRFPLFWLSFKNLPLPLFIFLCNLTLAKTGYLNLYFHPWEFADLTGYKIPKFIINPDGEKLTKKLQKFIEYYQKKQSVEFKTTVDFLKENDLIH